MTVTVLTAVPFTHKVVYTSFSRARVANPKRAPLLCTWFSFALRGDTKVVLELNTGIFWDKQKGTSTDQRDTWINRGKRDG